MGSKGIFVGGEVGKGVEVRGGEVGWSEGERVRVGIRR